MSEQDVLGSIEGLRSHIDDIDEQIVALLNKRQVLALAIRALKPQAQLGLFDPKREEQIYERIGACNEGPLYADDLRSIYAVILKVSKEMQG
ncbi:MAG: chorismate mutase [Coriobacteriales bacterium]|jgi:chorismate mutase|nr:chorismate mutase [Coriobacteriales bacterium]